MLRGPARCFQDWGWGLHTIGLHRCTIAILTLPCLSHHFSLFLQEIQLGVADSDRRSLGVSQLRRVAPFPLPDGVISIQDRRQGRPRTSRIGGAQVGQPGESRRYDIHTIDRVGTTASSCLWVVRAGRRVRHVDAEMPIALCLSLSIVSGRHACRHAVTVRGNTRLRLVCSNLVLAETLRLRRHTRGGLR
jgi:hypothetical protein